jgi:hypothetical protein
MVILDVRQICRVQVLPIRIELLDRTNFPSAIPALNLFFARDRVANVVVLFEPHEPMHTVTFGESWNEIVLVLINASVEIARDSRVESAVALACEDVYPALQVRSMAMRLLVHLRGESWRYFVDTALEHGSPSLAVLRTARRG